MNKELNFIAIKNFKIKWLALLLFLLVSSGLSFYLFFILKIASSTSMFDITDIFDYLIFNISLILLLISSIIYSYKNYRTSIGFSIIIIVILSCVLFIDNILAYISGILETYNYIKINDNIGGHYYTRKEFIAKAGIIIYIILYQLIWMRIIGRGSNDNSIMPLLQHSDDDL